MTWGQTDTTALSSLSTNGFSNPALKILNPYSPATPRQTVSARLYASCATTPGSAQLGVYDVTDGHAGAPRVTVASVNIPVMAEGWISFTLPTVILEQGRTYHAAIVGNRNGDSRLYRKTTPNSVLVGGSVLLTNWSGVTLSNLDWLFEVITSPVMSIDTINSDSSNPDIDVTASNTATTTGLGTITACTFTDSSGFVSTATPTMPSGDGSFVFAWPWADGSQQAKFGGVTASMTDGTVTATLPANLALPATYSSTTWSGATDLGEFYLGHYLTLTNDNRVYYPTVVDGITVTINPDGWMSFSSLPVTVPLLLHDCRSGGTGTITTKTLVVTESGVVIEDTTPTVGSFGSVTGADITTLTTLPDVVTISGVTAAVDIPAIPASGTEYRVSTNGGSSYGDWTSATTNVQLGFKLQARKVSSSSYSTPTTARVTVGGVNFDGTIVTTVSVDNVPDVLIFTSFTNAEVLSEHTSATVTVTGMSVGESSAFTVANGTYSKNGGSFISTAGTMQAGDTFALRGTSDTYFGRSKDVTLTAANGPVVSTYRITNKLDPLLPTGGGSTVVGQFLTGYTL